MSSFLWLFVQAKSQFTHTHTYTYNHTKGRKNGAKKSNRWVRTPTKYRADLITFFVGTSSKCQLLLSSTRTHAHTLRPSHLHSPPVPLPVEQASKQATALANREPYGQWPLNVALNKGQAFFVARLNLWVAGLQKDVSWPSAFQGEHGAKERDRDRESERKSESAGVLN